LGTTLVNLLLGGRKFLNYVPVVAGGRRILGEDILTNTQFVFLMLTLGFLMKLEFVSVAATSLINVK